MRLVQSGTGYLSQDQMRLHFGLGSPATVDAIEVLLEEAAARRREPLLEQTKRLARAARRVRSL